MPEFKYTARNAQGQLVNGVLECNDRAAAIRQVEAQRFVPIKIEAVEAKNAQTAATASGGGASGTSKTTKASSSKADARRDGSSSSPATAAAAAGEVQTMSYGQQYLFTEQLAHLLAAGMTLDEALGILERRMKHPRLHGLSKSLHRALVDGRSLSQALRDFPKIFSPLYVNMVAAGEASGALSDILKRLTTHLSDLKAMRDRVQQALLYPALLVVAGIGLIVIFMTVMVPQLTSFFKETNATLPVATRILLDLNSALTNYWWALLLVMGGIYAGVKAYTATPTGRLAWDTMKWKLPLYSLIIRFRYYAQFARTLGTLSENGVTLLRALELLEPIADNEYVRLRMGEVRLAVVDGATLSKALAVQKVFPEMFVDMMSVGEQTGRFGETMGNIADMYERELDKQVKVISTLIPPMVMLVIASIVGFVVFGILSAIFSLTSGLRGGMQ